jgi:A/G-specific adenine glycosylase
MGKRHDFGISGASLDALAAWFEKKKRVLPWRDEPTLYRVWVSEIMLQQTQVITVVPYFERFMARFPTAESLASAPEADVLAQWAGLGYYSRARNLHKAAQQIVAQGFPKDREGWLEIPGVGQYTAGAILSIALDQPEAILDGNVERVLSRVREVTRAGGDAEYKEALWRHSRAVVEQGHKRGLRPNVINQALMELGATTCTPRKPLCVFCPFKKICGAFAKSEQESYPPRKKPKQWLNVQEELHCVLDGQGRVLLRQREAGEWRAGLWDLLNEAPGKLERIGKVETKHVVTRHKIARVTHVWQMRKLRAAESSDVGVRWVTVDDPEVAVGSALKRTLQAVRERFGLTTV